MVTVSGSCLLGNVRINYYASNASRISGRKDDSTSTIVELLIGPCKAEELSHLINIRSKYSAIRRDINYLLTMLTALQNDPISSTRSPRALSGDSSANMKLSPMTSFYYSSNKVDYSNIRPSSASSSSAAGAAVVAHQTQSSKSVNRLSSFSSESINQDGSYDYQRNSNNTSNISEDLLLKVRSIASCLEFNYQFLLANQPSFSSSSSSTGTVNSSLFSDSFFLFEWEKTYISLLYNYVRTNIISNFFLQFPFLLSSSELPAYSLDCIKAVLDHDIEESQLLTTIKENIIRIESVKERFQVFLNNSIDTLRDFILFSAKVTFSDSKNACFCQLSLPLSQQLSATPVSSSLLAPTIPSQTNHLSTATAALSAPFPMSSSLLLIPFQIMQELTSDLRSFDAVKSPLEYLILQYYSTIQKGLQLYDLFEKEKYFKSSLSSSSSSSSAFNKHLKAILLSFLIEYNYEFYEKCLLLFDINYSMIHIEPKLVLHSSLVDLIQWFYLENFHESKQMIYKTFHPSSSSSSSSTVKASSHSQPQSQVIIVGDNRCWWNVDYNLDGFYVSSIPDTVQSYLSFYIELYQSLKRPNIVMMNRSFSSSSSSSSSTDQRPTSFSLRNTTNAAVDSGNSNASHVSYYGKLCKKILLLIHNSWLIVGNEFYHVSQVTYQEFFSTNHKLISSLSSSTSASSTAIALQSIITKHVYFLLSVVNDCLKIENEFIPIMKDLSNYLLVSSFNNQSNTNSSSNGNNANSKYKNGMEIILKTLKNDSYDVIIEQVLLMICQMMFCGVSSYLLAFDSYWFNQNINSKNPFQPTYCLTIICENFLFYFHSIRSMISSSSHLLAFVYLVEETIISRYFLLFQNSLKQKTMKPSSSSSICFSQDQLQQFRKDFLYFKDFFEKIENDLKNKILQSNPLQQGKTSSSSSSEEDGLFISSTLQWSLSPLTYFDHFVSLILEPISSFSFNQSLRFLVAKYDNDAMNFTNHDISLFLDYFLLHIVLPLHSSSTVAVAAMTSSGNANEKQALYDYFIKILDGNQEDIYRQTNSFCPIHITSASSRENGNGINASYELNEEELENQFFKRDLFWRMFSSELCRHNLHDSSVVTIDEPSSLSSVRNDEAVGANDIIQNVFKGLFQHHNSKGAEEENQNNNSSSSNLTSSSKKGRKSFTKKLGMKQTKAIVQNIRDSASDFIHLMNFSSSTTLSIDTHHHKNSSVGEISYDLESIFRLLGLEVLPYDIASDYRNIAEERDPAASAKPHSVRQTSFRDLQFQASASVVSNPSAKGGVSGIAENSQGENNSGTVSNRHSVSRGESLKTPQTNANPGKGLFSTFFSPSLRLRDESKLDDQQQEGLTIQKTSPSPKNGSSIPTPATGGGGGGMTKTPSIKKALSFFDESDSSILVDSPMKASSHHPSENSSPDRHNQNHSHRADVSINTNKFLSASSSSSTNVLPSSSFSLSISHIAVQGVHSHGLFSSKANPYAYFLIPRFQVKEKTTVAYNCNQAYFPGMLTLSFSFFSPVTSPSLPVVVHVYDKEKIRRKQLIGWNEINLFDYFSSTLSQERKGSVFGRNHQDDETTASVSLLLRNPDSYENPSAVPSSSAADVYGKITFEMKLTKK
jgi:hypothetical protein